MTNQDDDFQSGKCIKSQKKTFRGQLNGSGLNWNELSNMTIESSAFKPKKISFDMEEEVKSEWSDDIKKTTAHLKEVNLEDSNISDDIFGQKKAMDSELGAKSESLIEIKPLAVEFKSESKSERFSKNGSSSGGFSSHGSVDDVPVDEIIRRRNLRFMQNNALLGLNGVIVQKQESEKDLVSRIRNEIEI